MSAPREFPPPHAGEVSPEATEGGEARRPRRLAASPLDTSPVNGGGKKALTAAIAAGVVLGMTGLAFAAVPLYKAFCAATGYGGTTQMAAAAPSRVLDRTIEVRFDTNVTPGLAMDFAPEQRTQTLRIGATGLAFFHVRNVSDRPITAIATYNVQPETTGRYFVKLECFCFNERVLAPGEEADFPVVYFVDPELASDPETSGVDSVTLSYTYFASRGAANAALTQ